MSKEHDHSTPRQIFDQQSAHMHALRMGHLRESPNDSTRDRLSEYEIKCLQVERGAITNQELLQIARERMRDHITDHRGSINQPPHIEMNEAGLSVVLERISAEDIPDKLESIVKRGVELNPVEYIVAATLYTKFRINKDKARQASHALLNWLFMERREAEKIQERVEEELILTPELVKQGLDLISFTFEEETSVAQQLSDPFTLAAKGLIVTTTRTDGITLEEQQGILLPQTLLSILEHLKSQKSAAVLEQATYQALVDDPEHCITFLKTLADFTAEFLDSYTYYLTFAGKIDKAAGQTDNVNLLPLHALITSVDGAITYLKGKGGFEMAVKELENTREIIISRYHQVLTGPLKDELSTSDPKALEPLVDDLVIKFWEWAQPRLELGIVSQEEAAQYVVRLLMQAGVEDIGHFTDLLKKTTDILELDGMVESLGQKIIKEAVKMNAIDDPDGSITPELIKETHDQLIENPWKDLAHYDFKELFGDYDKVEIYLLTGTFGPWHNGHTDLRDKILSFMEHQDKLDGKRKPQNGDKLPATKRILLIAPLLRTAIRNYDKKYKNVGPVSKRIGAIMLQNADMDHNRVFLTTALQADPASAGDIAKSINHLETKFRAELDKATKGGVAGQGVEIVICGGTDEAYDDSGKHLKLDKPKFQLGKRHLIVGRHGFLGLTIKHATEIRRHIQADYVFTSGFPQSSSTKLVEQLPLTGTAPVQAAALPYILENWGKQAVDDRARGKRPESKKKPAISTVYARLVEDYNKYMATNGVS